MNRIWCAFALSVMLAGAMATTPAAASPASDQSDCGYGPQPDAAIAACSRAIASGRFRGGDLGELHGKRADLYYRFKQDYDRAIADYTRAIQLYAASREDLLLDPLPELYRGRGDAYVKKGEYDRAIADYNEAIKRDRNVLWGYHSRGDAYAAKGELNRAISDYSDAIQLHPTNDTYYLSRGIAHLYSGALGKAQGDIVQASTMQPSSPLDLYKTLWLDLVNVRAKQPSVLAQAILRMEGMGFSKKLWPGPLMQLLLGQSTPDDVLAAAETPPPQKLQQTCEANFFIGQMALRQGTKDEAARRFRLAAAKDCPKVRAGWWAASAELKALGASR